MSGLKGLHKKDNPDYEARTGVNGQTYYKKKDDVSYNDDNRDMLHSIMSDRDTMITQATDDMEEMIVEDFLLDSSSQVRDMIMDFPVHGSVRLRDRTQEEVLYITSDTHAGVFQKKSELYDMNEQDYNHTVDQWANMDAHIHELGALRADKIKHDKKHLQELKKQDPDIKRGYNLIVGTSDDYIMKKLPYSTLEPLEGLENQIIIQNYIDTMSPVMESMGLTLDCQELYRNAYNTRRISTEPVVKVHHSVDGSIITRGSANPNPRHVFTNGLRYYEQHDDTHPDYDVSFNQAYNTIPVTTMEKSVVGNYWKFIDGKITTMARDISESARKGTLQHHIVEDTDPDSVNDKLVSFMVRKKQGDVYFSSATEGSVFHAFVSNPHVSTVNLHKLLDNPGFSLTTEDIDAVKKHPHSDQKKIADYVTAHKDSIARADRELAEWRKSQRDQELRVKKRQENIARGKQMAESYPELADVVTRAATQAKNSYDYKSNNNHFSYEVPIPREVRDKLGDDYVESMLPSLGVFGSSYYDEKNQVYKRTYDDYTN